MAIPSIAAHRHFLEFVFTPSVPYRLLVMTSTEKHMSLCICKGSCRQFTFRFPNSCHANRALHLQKISCFLWVVNAAIQPLEKSASKLLICNGRIFNASGLRVFDASRDREKKGPERTEAGERARNPIRGTFFGCCASARRTEARVKPTSKTTMVLIAIPACLLPFIAGCLERFLANSTRTPLRCQSKCRPMSRQAPFKGLFWLVRDPRRRSTDWVRDREDGQEGD